VTENPPLVSEQRRTFKHSLLLVVICCLLLCGGSCYWLFLSPQYVVLDVPAPDQYGWSYQQKSVQRWTDSGSTYYLWRTEAWVVSCACNDLREELIAKFDEWFESQGWKKVDTADDPPTCGATFPEANFFEVDGESGYIIYRKQTDADRYYIGPQACLAIWDSHVVLQTENPSGWTAFLKSLD
jgi:hypothetical protein